MGGQKRARRDRMGKGMTNILASVLDISSTNFSVDREVVVWGANWEAYVPLPASNSASPLLNFTKLPHLRKIWSIWLF